MAGDERDPHGAAGALPGSGWEWGRWSVLAGPAVALLEPGQGIPHHGAEASPWGRCSGPAQGETLPWAALGRPEGPARRLGVRAASCPAPRYPGPASHFRKADFK